LPLFLLPFPSMPFSSSSPFLFSAFLLLLDPEHGLACVITGRVHGHDTIKNAVECKSTKTDFL
jgi:hypothetical protein